MNLCSIRMVAFFLAPILVSPRLLPDAHPEQSLSGRGLPLFPTPHDDTLPPPAARVGVGSPPGEDTAHTTEEDGEMNWAAFLGSPNLPPMPDEQGQHELDWANFIAAQPPHYLVVAADDLRPWAPDDQDSIDAFSMTAHLVWHAATGAVELQLHPRGEDWIPPRGYTRYFLSGGDARRVPRSYIYENDDPRQDGDILRGRYFPGDPAIDAVLRFYTGPNVDNEAVQESLETGLFMASSLDSYFDLPQDQIVSFLTQMGGAIRLMQHQQGSLAPEDEHLSSVESDVVSHHGKRQNPVYPLEIGDRTALSSTIENRAEPLKTIESQERNSSASTANHAAEFKLYFQAFQILQSHIRSLLYPVLSPLITNSNSTLVHQIAWSIWCDITASTTFVVGSFKNGLSSMTYLEDQYLNSTHQSLDHILSKNGTVIADVSHSSTSRDTNTSRILGMLAVHGLLESLYFETWDRAINATNATGQLANLARLATYLQPTDPSIAPPGFFNASRRRNDGLMTPPMSNATSFNLNSSRR